MKIRRGGLRLDCFLGLAALASSSAHAFSLADHTALTRQAVLEFNQCFPDQAVQPAEEASIVSANEGEDLNVFRKWISFSHFYHPEKRLQMRRGDSADRVLDLSDELEAHAHDHEAQSRDIGHLIHHLQDMASPPHVVPVNHWLTDGFERYRASVEVTEVDCTAILAEASSFELLLKTTAEATLRAVRGGGFSATLNGTATHVPMSGFWQESASEQFGAYGWLGNSYGEPRIELRPSRGQRPKRTQVYAVGENDYLSFKQRQMRLAVEATKAALAIWRWKI